MTIFNDYAKLPVALTAVTVVPEELRGDRTPVRRFQKLMDLQLTLRYSYSARRATPNGEPAG